MDGLYVCNVGQTALQGDTIKINDMKPAAEQAKTILWALMEATRIGEPMSIERKIIENGLIEYASQNTLSREKVMEIDEETLQQDFRDWLGWNDQKAPDPDDPDYYTYSWGMNVWCNAYRAYKKALFLPTLSEGEIENWLKSEYNEQLIQANSKILAQIIARAIKELLNHKR